MLRPQHEPVTGDRVQIEANTMGGQFQQEGPTDSPEKHPWTKVTTRGGWWAIGWSGHPNLKAAVLGNGKGNHQFCPPIQSLGFLVPPMHSWEVR